MFVLGLTIGGYCSEGKNNFFEDPMVTQIPNGEVTILLSWRIRIVPAGSA
jgi:hypothetical protein